MIPIDPAQYPKLVIALGGNALIRPGEAGTEEEQRRRISEAMAQTADLVTSGFAAATQFIHQALLDQVTQASLNVRVGNK